MSNKIKIKKKNKSTLTFRIAALQVKMLHIQFRMKKIYDDQKLLNENKKKFNTNRELIKGIGSTVYSTIDILITMEHLYQLIADIFATSEIRQHFDKKTYEILNKTKEITKKWKYVRNKLGGHIDIDITEKFCKENNFKGVFISKDLESDVSILNFFLIESAVNSARKSSDIFGRDLDFKNNLSAELEIFVDKLNSDWNDAFLYFPPIMELMYAVGTKEKLAWAGSNNQEGLIVGD